VAAAEARAEAAEALAAELAVADERLTARVAELERRLGRNSGNSSMPPSSDTFGRPEKKPQPRSGRKRGRQPGTDGSGLAMTGKPDATEDHVPAVCTGCGSTLDQGDSVGFERRQVRDIPLSTVKVTEHRAHRCRCTCGQGITVGLSEHPRAPGRKQSPARNLLERLRDQAHSILRFADDPRHVPFTNNCGERALRPVKTQLKISGCHHSETGATAWLAVRSYLDSARKHGPSAFEAIHRAFTGNLWMPPIKQAV
jgi:hypothetical protein